MAFLFSALFDVRCAVKMFPFLIFRGSFVLLFPFAFLVLNKQPKFFYFPIKSNFLGKQHNRNAASTPVRRMLIVCMCVCNTHGVCMKVLFRKNILKSFSLWFFVDAEFDRCWKERKVARLFTNYTYIFRSLFKLIATFPEFL